MGKVERWIKTGLKKRLTLMRKFDKQASPIYQKFLLILNCRL